MRLQMDGIGQQENKVGKLKGVQKMVPEYRVITLKMGTMRVDKSTLTYGIDFGQEMEIPVWAVAVEGGGHRVLIDTGVADPGWVRTNLSQYCHQEPDETLEGALREIGWDISDVDIVINTHLHYDHSDNNYLLPHARFYVSEREWLYASTPIDTQGWIYNGSWHRKPLSYFNYIFVASDHYEVLPGLRLIQTPGHSAGHQSVLVNTVEGILCVSGDALNLIENLKPGVPPGLLFSTEEALLSIAKVRNFADCVIAGHDPGIKKYQDSGFPELN